MTVFMNSSFILTWGWLETTNLVLILHMGSHLVRNHRIAPSCVHCNFCCDDGVPEQWWLISMGRMRCVAKWPIINVCTPNYIYMYQWRMFILLARTIIRQGLKLLNGPEAFSHAVPIRIQNKYWCCEASTNDGGYCKKFVTNLSLNSLEFLRMLNFSRDLSF